MTVTKIYHSREDLLTPFISEEERVQYQNVRADIIKVYTGIDKIFDATEHLEGQVEEYVSAMHGEDEEAAAIMRNARQELIHKWTALQAAVSGFARILRIDGNEAFERHVTGRTMEGL